MQKLCTTSLITRKPLDFRTIINFIVPTFVIINIIKPTLRKVARCLFFAVRTSVFFFFFLIKSNYGTPSQQTKKIFILLTRPIRKKSLDISRTIITNPNLSRLQSADCDLLS